MKPHTVDINRVVVHHSASPSSTTIRDIQEWHVDQNGWDAIGYHYVITSLGLIEYTRPIHMQGAHARGFNNGTIGICLIGNNTEELNRWSREQVNALQRLWLSLRTVFQGLDVCGHRDLTDGTVCPGVDVRPMMLGPRY